jgi:uncharacterized membrane-anchored protein
MASVAEKRLILALYVFNNHYYTHCFKRDDRTPVLGKLIIIARSLILWSTVAFFVASGAIKFCPAVNIINGQDC